MLGNRALASASFTWAIDTTPPGVCSIAVRTPSPFVGVVNNTNMAVSVTGVDESIVSSTYSVDGASDWSNAAHTESGLSVLVQISGDGMHTMLFKARDAAGNESPKPCFNFSWIVDMTAPIVTIVPDVGFRTRNDWVMVSVQSGEALSAVFIWFLGAPAWARSPRNTVILNTTGVGPKFALFKGGTFQIYMVGSNCYVYFWQLIW